MWDSASVDAAASTLIEDAGSASWSLLQKLQEDEWEGELEEYYRAGGTALDPRTKLLTAHGLLPSDTSPMVRLMVKNCAGFEESRKICAARSISSPRTIAYLLASQQRVLSRNNQRALRGLRSRTTRSLRMFQLRTLRR